MPRRSSIGIVSICIALVASGVPALANGVSDGPIVLTNEDVKRLKKSAEEGDGNDAGSGLIIVPDADRPSTAPASNPDPRYTAPTRTNPAPAARASDNAPSWQEEYYRLKTLALQQAMERGEPIHFGDVPEAAASGADPGRTEPSAHSAARHGATGPSCVYGTNGKLIHGPPGMGCSAVRIRGLSSAGDAAGGGSATCLYGLHGEVLHAPPGRSCKRSSATKTTEERD